MNRYLKTGITFGIIGLTIGAFIYYIAHHPATLSQLARLSPFTVIALLVLYAVWFLALALITRGSLRIYQKYMSRQENLLFNAYSTLINFFGPGQSGPIFRGAYLKKRHNLGIKQYMFTVLLYYGFYAVISVLCMCIGSRPWWQTALLMVAAGAGSLIAVGWYKKRSQITTGKGLTVINVGWILAATIVQIAVQAIIYGIELHNAGINPSVGQVLAYTGVANLALFVALTPGAIGIRESFLWFSQNLHHIDSAAIVAANVIDRAVYLAFLGGLFVLVLGLHAKDKLHVNQLSPPLEQPVKTAKLPRAK